MFCTQWLGLAICLLILAPNVVRSETLASSGNPMKGANPSRNGQINKNLLCPDVAPGRTQVWNVAWQSKPPTGWFSNYGGDLELVQDEEGFIYLHGTIGADPNSKILKINGTDGSYDVDLMYSAPFTYSQFVPTLVKGNRMYNAAYKMTTIVNTTSMTDIAVIPHSTFDASLRAYPAGSYAPFNSNFMATHHPNPNPVNVLRYLNTTALEFNEELPNLYSSYANDVIIYTNSSGVDIPIVVVARAGYDGPITVWSPNYQFTLPESNLFYDQGYIQNDLFFLQYANYPQFQTTLAVYDPNTGSLLQNFTRDSLDGQKAYFGPLKAFGTKVYASSSVGSMHQVVELFSGKTLLEGRQLTFRPTYSIPDNSVLLGTQSGSSEPLELVSLDWDTDAITAVGGFPNDAYFGDVTLSPPLIGDDCNIHMYLDDGSKYRTTLFAFSPMPISEVVPMLECINADGLAYFSYHNLEDKRIVIPFASDRNNLEPMNVAPSKDFRALQRGKYFPLSSRVLLDQNTTTFTWHLEDYYLSFNNSALLRCPITVRFVMYFNVTATVPSGFAEWTRQAFVSIVGISDWRVTVVTTKKRDAVPSDLEVELQVIAANTTQEPTPEQSVQQFVEEQVYQYNQLLGSDPTYSPAGIKLLDVDGQPVPTEISGVKRSQPQSQPPVDQPSASNAPSSNTNATPKASTTSHGSSFAPKIFFVATTVMALIMMVN